MARKDKHSQRCVVLYRDGKTKDWTLQAICERLDVAWRSAWQSEQQEHRMGHKGFKAIVAEEGFLDNQPLKVIRPPVNFEFGGVPIGRMQAEEEAAPAVPAKPVKVPPPPIPDVVPPVPEPEPAQDEEPEDPFDGGDF
jgi:hypothetical protein